jgi:hypothetical protein
MTEAQQTQTVDALSEIIKRLDNIDILLVEVKGEVMATNGRVTELEDWRSEHQPWSESGRDLIQAQTDSIAEVNMKLDRMSVDILTRVSSSMQAMVHDAMTSGFKEDFPELYGQMVEEGRERRKKELKDAFGTAKSVALWVTAVLVPFSIIGQWFNWW